MYSPDERRAIRAERNRNAAPSGEEAAADHRRHLAEKGCRICGETDPDELEHGRGPTPSCPAIQCQYPTDPTYVMCDDCYADRPSIRERAFRKAQKINNLDHIDKRVIGIAFFECGAWQFVESELVEKHDGIELYEDDFPGYCPKVNVHCRCGADFREYAALRDKEGEN